MSGDLSLTFRSMGVSNLTHTAVKTTFGCAKRKTIFGTSAWLAQLTACNKFLCVTHPFNVKYTEDHGMTCLWTITFINKDIRQQNQHLREFKKCNAQI